MKKTSQMTRVLATACAVTAAAACTFVAEKPAQAQEIQLTGPLAGAPPVRRLRLRREGRVEFAPGFGATILNEYKHNLFVTGRLQYNVFEWLGLGVYGGFAFANLNTDLADKIDAQAPRETRTAINIPNAANGVNQAFDEQVGKLQWMATPQATISPFRGKLALFQKVFVDTDLYLHGGVAFVGVQERVDCGGAGQPGCATAAGFGTAGRVAVAPSFGMGLTLYTSNFVSLNFEYRAFPFSWNRGGFDSRGAGPDVSFPDNKIDSEDRTFKFNQMVGLNIGLHFPTAPKLSD